MSIKANITLSALGTTLIVACCFHATDASAADWTEDSKGYTLNCDIAYKEAVFGQWKTFEARFSLPADAKANLWYECQDGGGKGPMRDPSYDFHCEVKVDQPGVSLNISRVGYELHIKGLVPGYITPNYACKKVAEAAKVEVRKGGK